MINLTTKEDIFSNKLDIEKNKINAYEVFLGDCIGNFNGYQGRENWVLIDYKEDTLEVMALQKLSKVYNKGKEELSSIISKSNNDIIKLIKMRTNLMDQRQEIEETESRLDNIAKEMKNFDFEEEGQNQLSKSNFPNQGLLLEIFKPKNLFLIEKSPKMNLITRKLTSMPIIKGSRISVLNFINEFNLESEKPHEYLLSFDKSKSIIRISGFLVSNEGEEYQIRIETNSK